MKDGEWEEENGCREDPQCRQSIRIDDSGTFFHQFEGASPDQAKHQKEDPFPDLVRSHGAKLGFIRSCVGVFYFLY
jgi:hypothetical protein